MAKLGRTMGTLAVIGIAALALLILPGLASPVSASPVPLGSSTSQQWAYGAQKWANVTTDLPNATYTSHAFFGWQVVYTATNTSATTVALEAQRTMAVSFSAQYCSPNCGNATSFGNLNITAWETDAGFANLSTAGTVYVNDTPTPAVALLNASSEVRGNISESLSYTIGGVTGLHSASASLTVAGSAHASVSFVNGLGLVPYNATAGEKWNSSAAFSAAGGWSVNASWARTTFLGAKLSGHPSASSTVQASGTVYLVGFDAGNVTLTNGQTVPVIVLAWTGPFDDIDGVILVPHDFDLFGSAAQPYASDSLGAQAVSTSNLDIRVDAFHHLRVVAAATSYAATDGSLNSAAPSATGPSPASTSSGSPTVVQAQPESVAQAQQSSGCLVNGCPSSHASSSLAGSLGLAVVVGLLVVVVVGTVAVVEYRVWSRRHASGGMPGTQAGLRAAPLPPPGATYGNTPSSAPPPPRGSQEPPKLR